MKLLYKTKYIFPVFTPIFSEKKATGIVGWTTYEMKAKDEWNKVTCMLAKFAEYSNVDGNRTGGFGVTKFISKPNTPISS